ncbi:MAG: CoA pyrophosphatase [Deltaproteobacteria bacterium]|nr:CoA pyrophosphatase [Deltaproteobacteria bacterium]
MKTKFKKILSAYEKNALPAEGLRPSAVLVPLFKKDNQDTLLFTKRNQNVAHHKGEICFPGGMMDDTDKDLIHTALREVYEEVGIQPEAVEILGSLDEIVTPTGFHITPFLGIFPYPYSFQVNKDEIDLLLEIPFEIFLDSKKVSYQERTYSGKTIQMPFYQWQGHTIWGATGLIVKQIVDLILKVEQEKQSA